MILICLTSCKKDECVSFGTVEYYPSFLWVDSNITPVTKTFDFDFSQDAKDDNSFAEFQFVDNEGKPISTNVMQVTIEGKEIANNKFRINSDVSSTEFTFKFSPNAEKGKYQGYLKLVSHTLDRLDSQPLTSGQQVDAFQWTLNFDESMNPLAKLLMWIGIAILALLALWFFILRPILYPHFAKFTKSVLIEKDGKKIGQLNFAFKGARKVVFHNQKKKQSFWNRFFFGEIRTLVNSNFVSELTFVPRRNSANAHGIGYTIQPNPIPRSGIAKIFNPHEKITITLS